VSKAGVTRFNPPPSWPVKKNFVPPQGWQPDPAWGPAPQGWPLYVTEARKTHRFRNFVLLPIAAVIAIGVAVSIGRGGSSTSTTAPAGGASATPPVATNAATAVAAAAKKTASTTIGSKVSVGDFDYVVTSFKCGAKSVGGQYDGTKASGQFCLANLTVTNHGNEANTFDDDAQYLYSATGQKYSVSDDADTTIEIESNANVLDQLNPGVTEKTTIAFDVPLTGFVPDHLALVSGLGIIDTPANVSVR
jgi:hypothetical protein